MAGHAPPVAAQDDVNAVAPQPGPLVEPVLRPVRLHEDTEHLDDGTLGRRATARKLEHDRLDDCEPAEAHDAPRNANLETSAARRAGNDDPGAGGSTELGGEWTPGGGGEPGAPPPPARETERNGDEGRSLDGVGTRCGGEACDDRNYGKAGTGHPSDVCGRDSGAERTQQNVGKRGREPPGQGTTSSRSWSSRAGPMPGMASSSSTDRKAPCCERKSKIFCAVTGPTPGSASSASSVAVLRLTGPVVVAAALGCAAVPTPTAPGALRGTATCWPSAIGAARLTLSRSAFGVAPPARPTASATRAPSANR